MTPGPQSTYRTTHSFPTRRSSVLVAGVVVMDRDPIEFRAKVDFDPAHKVAGVRRQGGQVSAVFRRDDGPELVAIVLAAIKEGLRLGAVLGQIGRAHV